MNTIIDADAAKLAGLQIDTLQKVRSGQITLGQWERFNNLSTDDREARFGDWKKPESTAHAEPTEKFALFVDLGIITVPDNYDHATALKSFGNKNRRKFYYYNDEITDKNFPNPTRVLKPGDKLHVRVFKQIVSGRTTSEERMDFLRKENAVFTGAQGASLVFDQKRDKLPVGKWYASFDEKDRLLLDTDGDHKLLNMRCTPEGVFSFRLGFFESEWHDVNAFLCFCDVK